MNSSIFFLSWFLASLVGVYLFRNVANTFGWMDIPNSRSSHQAPIARGGGLIIVALWGLLVWTQYPDFIRSFFWPCLLVAGVGFMDDLMGSSLWVRLGSHFGAAFYFTLFVLFHSHWPSEFMGLVLMAGIIFALVWSLNLFNFMDGSDGLAIHQAVFVLIYLACNFWNANEFGFIVATIMICFGFFVWNYPRAKVFMGDVGSGFLGFLLMALGLWAHQEYGISLVGFFAVYSFFVVDATLTLILRLIAGENFLKAHRSHTYQRWIHDGGLSHAKVLGISFWMNTFCLTVALLGPLGGRQWFWPEWLVMLAVVAIHLIYQGFCFWRIPYAMNKRP